MPTTTCRITGASSRRTACIRSDLKRLEDLAQVPVHHQAGSARELSVRHVRGAARARSCAFTHPAARPANRPSSATPQSDIDIWADLMARSIRAVGRAAGRHRAHRLRLRPVHRRARRALRRRAAGLHGDADVGRADRKAGAAHPGFRARHHHGHAVVHADLDRRDGTAGHATRAQCSLEHRDLRRGALDASHARRDRAARGHRRRRHLWTVGGDGAGRRQRVHRNQGRAGDLGRSLLSRDHRSANRRGAARRQPGRAGVHLAHQGSAADDPLSHARSHAPAAAHCALHAPHGQDHRALRRHADHPRRQCVPVADRRADSAACRSSLRTICWCWRRTVIWTV